MAGCGTRAVAQRAVVRADAGVQPRELMRGEPEPALQCAVANRCRCALKKSDFHYELPPELIAQPPLPDRSARRLPARWLGQKEAGGAAEVLLGRSTGTHPRVAQPGVSLNRGEPPRIRLGDGTCVPGRGRVGVLFDPESENGRPVGKVVSRLGRM